MFRQTIILVSLIAGAFSWFEVGTRVDGDQNVFNQTTQSFETVLPTIHALDLLIIGGENTFTYSRFDVYEGYDAVVNYGVPDGNGFNLTVTNSYTRHLTVTATIYGFLPGQGPAILSKNAEKLLAPVKFVEPKN